MDVDIIESRRRFVGRPIELYGGPRDGERIEWAGAPYISFLEQRVGVPPSRELVHEYGIVYLRDVATKNVVGVCAHYLGWRPR